MQTLNQYFFFLHFISLFSQSELKIENKKIEKQKKNRLKRATIKKKIRNGGLLIAGSLLLYYANRSKVKKNIPPDQLKKRPKPKKGVEKKKLVKRPSKEVAPKDYLLKPTPPPFSEEKIKLSYEYLKSWNEEAFKY